MRKLFPVIAGLFIVLLLSACSTQKDTLTEKDLSKVYYDEAESYVEIYVQYNEKTHTNCAEYGIASESGSAADKAIFTTKCEVQDVYEALLAIGILPTHYKKKDTKTGCRAKGTHMEVYVSRENSIDHSFTSLVQTKSNSMFFCRFVFSGKIKTVNDSGTGGIVSLDSCVNSLISNSDYGYGYLSTLKMDEFYSSTKSISLTDGEVFKVRIFQSSEY